MKGSHRKGFIINHQAYTNVVDIQRVVVIRSTVNPLLFYNKFHNQFIGLNMADWFTTKEANFLIADGLENCEKVCEQKLYKGFNPPSKPY